MGEKSQLKEVSANLTSILRQTDTVCRMGGDEFAPLIPEIKVKEMVDEVAQRILVAMGTPFILHDIEERITVSFGIAIYQATRLVKDMFLEIAVLVLTESLNDSFVIDAIHAGAGGYIFLKDMTPEVLLQSIHHVIEVSHK